MFQDTGELQPFRDCHCRLFKFNNTEFCNLSTLLSSAQLLQVALLLVIMNWLAVQTKKEGEHTKGWWSKKLNNLFHAFIYKKSTRHERSVTSVVHGSAGGS